MPTYYHNTRAKSSKKNGAKPCGVWENGIFSYTVYSNLGSADATPVFPPPGLQAEEPVRRERKKRLFPTISRSPSFPYFTRNSGVFDTPRDNVSPPPKKEPRGEKTAAGRLVSYAQKKARRFVHLVYFSARFFYPCTFCTNRVSRPFLPPPGAFSSFRDP